MVGHDAKDPDAVIAIAAQGIEQKFQAGAVRFIRQDFGIGQPRVIVDGQMQIFPALAGAGHGRARQPGLAGDC